MMEPGENFTLCKHPPSLIHALIEPLSNKYQDEHVMNASHKKGIEGVRISPTIGSQLTLYLSPQL